LWIATTGYPKSLRRERRTQKEEALQQSRFGSKLFAGFTIGAGYRLEEIGNSFFLGIIMK
jgi:hypothetical protein